MDLGVGCHPDQVYSVCRRRSGSAALVFVPGGSGACLLVSTDRCGKTQAHAWPQPRTGVVVVGWCSHARRTQGPWAPLGQVRRRVCSRRFRRGCPLLVHPGLEDGPGVLRFLHHCHCRPPHVPCCRRGGQRVRALVLEWCWQCGSQWVQMRLLVPIAGCVVWRDESSVHGRRCRTSPGCDVPCFSLVLA